MSPALKLPPLIRSGVSVLADAATSVEVADRIAWVLLAGPRSDSAEAVSAELGKLSDKKFARWLDRWRAVLSPEEGSLLAGVSRAMVIDAVATTRPNEGARPVPPGDDGLEDAFNLAGRPGRFDTRLIREAIVRQLAAELDVADILHGERNEDAGPVEPPSAGDDSWGIRGKRRSATAAHDRTARTKDRPAR